MSDSRLQEAASASEAAGRQFPCRGCGAHVAFHPGAAALRCPYCGAVESIPETEDQIDESDFDAALAASRAPLAQVGPKTARCRGCGAAVQTTALADRCPFCGAPVVFEARCEDLLAPEAILPFGFNRSAAVDKFRDWLGSRWFAPSDLKALAAEDGVNGVYVPFWTFDCFTRSFYRGARGDAYFVTEHYTTTVNGRTESRTRQVRKIRWTPAAGRVQRAFDDVLVPAVKSLPPKDLAKLEPWDLGAMKPYAPEYAAGHLATRYEVDLSEGFDAAKALMTQVIVGDCKADIGGDEQRVDSVKTAWRAVTFKHVLLPVWSAAYQYRKKTWRVLVNARTGEVVGERPYSFWKIAGLVALVAAAIAAAFAFAS